MKDIFKDYLFNKHILVAENVHSQRNTPDIVLGVIITLGRFFGIQITEGAKMAEESMVQTCARNLGEYVSEPFYRGFPQTVRNLTQDQILFDKVMHYVKTYGGGDWEHDPEEYRSFYESSLKEDIHRLKFNESVQVKEFRIFDEKKADGELVASLSNLMRGTRPLSEDQLILVSEGFREYSALQRAVPKNGLPSKQNAVALYYDTRFECLLNGLKLSDTIRLLDYIQYKAYGSEKLNKLNLKNKDRKALIYFMESVVWNDSGIDGPACFEKRNIWKGMLHHLHYQPKNPYLEAFFRDIRNPDFPNCSYDAFFERILKEETPIAAAEYLKRKQGDTALIRHMDYIFSKCRNAIEDVEILELIDKCEKANPIAILQQMQHCLDGSAVPRTFAFTRHGKLKVHPETYEEAMSSATLHRREYKFWSGRCTLEIEAECLKQLLQRIMNGRLGKVWIGPGVERIAIPMNQSAGNSGFGTLPTGSRIRIPEGKKIRAFTYWEKVNDIDLSCFAMSEDESIRPMEFSWRTFGRAPMHGDDICFSGDVTDGYNGGSEYFDIDLNAIRHSYPNHRYIVFCDNVYSESSFDECLCKAGFMTRDILDSCEIFEPKTVSTSFVVNAKSRFAYLFAIDLKAGEMIWLNLNRDSRAAVAGDSPMGFLRKYFEATKAYNLSQLYSDAAQEIVENPEDADVIVTADPNFQMEGKDIVHPYDAEKIIALLNG